MRILITFLLLIAGSTISQAQKPIVLGETHEIQSVQLSEKRTLNIYLPPGYTSTDTTHYPVIYLLDGGLDEDFIHVTGLVQFNSFSWVNRVPESIVVGIANTDRKRDMTFPSAMKGDKQRLPTSGGSAKFIAYIEKEVQPYINSKFRTTTSRTIIGESAGGLLATEILFTKPALFNKYILISPSIWWDNGSLLKRTITAQPQSNTDIYIAVGKEGLAPCEEPHVMEVDANLLYDKIVNFHNRNISVYFDYLPEETHATIAQQALLNAFKVLQTK